MENPLRMDHSRKRKCDQEDEASEFMPLSKRINNLHLNTLPRPKSLVESETKEEVQKAANERLSSLPYVSRGVDDAPASQEPQWPPQYTPYLSSSENPFYYESNRLLYDLYQQRMQRHPFVNTIPHF
ncbi:hypothetical protein GE061_006849 [Apolygus lucorum]|uniref:Uncharacterized protein n=1 Tax=Apolygus lucorum TaxID=248454 RepID=A0A8S9WSN3_APOLU|nr:hypothetical protein GE061_006849 [Apolygus lucorum]